MLLLSVEVHEPVLKERLFSRPGEGFLKESKRSQRTNTTGSTDGSMVVYRGGTKPCSFSTMISRVPPPWVGLARPGAWQQAETLVGSHVFQASIVLCIVFNTFLLCLDSYPEDPDLVYVTEVRTSNRPNWGDTAVLQELFFYDVLSATGPQSFSAPIHTSLPTIFLAPISPRLKRWQTSTSRSYSRWRWP